MDVLQPLLWPRHPAPPAALPPGVRGRRLLGAARALWAPPSAQCHPALSAAPVWPLGGSLPLEPVLGAVRARPEEPAGPLCGEQRG